MINLLPLKNSTEQLNFKYVKNCHFHKKKKNINFVNFKLLMLIINKIDNPMVFLICQL